MPFTQDRRNPTTSAEEPGEGDNASLVGFEKRVL
jgi:hypothetical protein